MEYFKNSQSRRPNKIPDRPNQYQLIVEKLANLKLW